MVPSKISVIIRIRELIHIRFTKRGGESELQRQTGLDSDLINFPADL